MEENIVRNIVLTKEQSDELLKNLYFPQNDIIERRDKFLSDTNQYKWNKETLNSFSVDIPALDLTFVKAGSAFSYNLTHEVILEGKTDNQYVNLFDEVELKIETDKVLNNIVAEEGYYCDTKIEEEHDFIINNGQAS